MQFEPRDQFLEYYICRRVIDIFDDDGNGEVDFKEFIQVNIIKLYKSPSFQILYVYILFISPGTLYCLSPQGLYIAYLPRDCILFISPGTLYCLSPQGLYIVYLPRDFIQFISPGTLYCSSPQGFYIASIPRDFLCFPPPLLAFPSPFLLLFTTQERLLLAV